MSNQKIRVLIVDDSAFIRRALGTMIDTADDIEIIGTARNGKEGVTLASELQPDVITMDIEMPVMTGIEAVRAIMKDNPTPVLMISSLTTEGAEATMEAMEAGALDFVTKRSAFSINQSDSMKEELIEKIRAASRTSYFRRRRAAVTPPSTAQPGKPHLSTPQPLRPTGSPSTGSNVASDFRRRVEERRKAREANASTATPLSKSAVEAKPTGRKKPSPDSIKIIVLGVSTGGPLALHKVIPLLPPSLPVPMLIVQHMPPHFTKSLADRLNTLSKVTVKEAAHRDVLQPAHVYVAPGGLHMTVATDKKTILIGEEPSNTLHRPSVDVMMDSVINLYGSSALGVIMTGMGRDGCEALVRLHQLGGHVISQSEDSCVVYGMPKAVVDSGIADTIVPLEQLADTIASYCGQRALQPLS